MLANNPSLVSWCWLRVARLSVRVSSWRVGVSCAVVLGISRVRLVSFSSSRLVSPAGVFCCFSLRGTRARPRMPSDSDRVGASGARRSSPGSRRLRRASDALSSANTCVARADEEAARRRRLSARLPDDEKGDDFGQKRKKKETTKTKKRGGMDRVGGPLGPRGTPHFIFIFLCFFILFFFLFSFFRAAACESQFAAATNEESSFAESLADDFAHAQAKILVTIGAAGLSASNRIDLPQSKKKIAHVQPALAIASIDAATPRRATKRRYRVAVPAR
jgi:hypothetical protein